jgi:hypothetical protein
MCKGGLFMKKTVRLLNQSSSTARGPVIPPVTDMPTAEPAAALISSVLASNILGSLQSVMVPIVFFPVTVARMFTAAILFHLRPETFGCCNCIADVSAKFSTGERYNHFLLFFLLNVMTFFIHLPICQRLRCET